jgi:hypothetical protein
VGLPFSVTVPPSTTMILSASRARRSTTNERYGVAALNESSEFLGDQEFRLGVKRGGRLVEDEYRVAANKDAGDADPLPLPS